MLLVVMDAGLLMIATVVFFLLVVFKCMKLASAQKLIRPAPPEAEPSDGCGLNPWPGKPFRSAGRYTR